MGNSYNVFSQSRFCDKCGNYVYHSKYIEEENKCISCPINMCCKNGLFYHFKHNTNIESVINGETDDFIILDDAFFEEKDDLCYQKIISYLKHLKENKNLDYLKDIDKLLKDYQDYQYYLDFH